MRVKVELFFDVVSPYTYLAWQTLARYKDIWRIEIVYRPIFLAGVVIGSGNTPPASLPQKAAWMNSDIQRSVMWYGLGNVFKGVPSNFQNGVPRDALHLQRLLAVVANDKSVPQGVRFDLVDAAFHSTWEDAARRDEHNNLSMMTTDILKSLCVKSGMTDARAGELVSRSASNEGKDALKANTDLAIQLGHFGSPTMIVHSDRFGAPSSTESFTIFGSDRFEQLSFMLGKTWMGPTPKIAEKSKMSQCKL
jgi:glutathione S-transferase kappa 1